MNWFYAFWIGYIVSLYLAWKGMVFPGSFVLLMFLSMVKLIDDSESNKSKKKRTKKRNVK